MKPLLDKLAVIRFPYLMVTGFATVFIGMLSEYFPSLSEVGALSMTFFAGGALPYLGYRCWAVFKEDRHYGYAVASVILYILGFLFISVIPYFIYFIII